MGYKVIFVVVTPNPSTDHLVLDELLKNQFEDEILNVFLTEADRKFDVWVQVSKSIEQHLKNDIEQIIVQYMKLYRLDFGMLRFIGEPNLPTFTAVLRIIRILAPISDVELRVALERRQFSIPDQVWLNHRLDRLRKSELIVRRPDGRYFSSLDGLSILGSMKGRNSMDIRRALALTRNRE